MLRDDPHRAQLRDAAADPAPACEGRVHGVLRAPIEPGQSAARPGPRLNRDTADQCVRVFMNTIAYFEIQSDELDAAARFYKAVFGWEFVKDQTMPVRPS